MQQQTTNGQPGKRSADYVTLVAQACANVPGFAQLYKDMERSISISGKSSSLLTNYGRQLAHLALHFNCVPTELDAEQEMDYLHLVKSQGTTSATFFKFTVYGLRYACKLRGLAYESFGLPGIDHDDKLPVVLNQDEVRRLIKSCDLLKHKLLLSLLYGCGLRCSEVRSLTIADADLVRGMLHVRRGKGSKDRYVPLGPMLIRGIGLYIDAVRPRHWIFEGNVPGQGLSQRGTQWVVNMATKKAGIAKAVSTIRCGIVTPPTCCSRVSIFSALKNYWGMSRSTLRWCTCTSPNPQLPMCSARWILYTGSRSGTLPRSS